MHFIGLENSTVQACISILGVMSTISSVRWHQDTVENADVLMVCSSKLASLSISKPFIAVYRTGDPKPNARHLLSLPFRAMPLMTELEDIYQQSFANKPLSATVKQEKTASLDDTPLTLLCLKRYLVRCIPIRLYLAFYLCKPPQEPIT